MKLYYGVYKGDLPVMTCADYKPENIPGFGSCLCPEKKYAGCVPMNPEVHPDGEKAVKLPENEKAHICIPRIRSGWKQAEGRTMIYTGEERYVPALTDEAVLVCQYGGLINVRSAAKSTITKQAAKKKNPLPRETDWLNKKIGGKPKEYVTMAEIKSLGWELIQDYYKVVKTGKKSDWFAVRNKNGKKIYFKPDPAITANHRNIMKQDIINLNKVLEYFKITNHTKICMFIAQISQECLKGYVMCEQSSTAEHPLKGSTTRTNMTNWYKDNKKYPFQYRGGGAMQLTHKGNYKHVSEYIGDKKIKEGTEYLAFNYPWLSAGVFWDWKNLNNETDFRKITKIINGGYTHYEERKKLYADCLKKIKKK